MSHLVLDEVEVRYGALVAVARSRWRCPVAACSR